MTSRVVRVACFFFFALRLGWTADAADAQQILTGTIGGALYELAVPTEWNGQLVVYAHGIVDPQLPVALPTNEAQIAVLRDALVANGFGFAASSDRENVYAVQDGAVRTHQLRGLFVSRVGMPSHTYLMGHSLGALIVLKLAEEFPEQYDGALPMCGLVGGSPFELQYLGDARVLFDYFFPRVVPGDVAHPPVLDFSPGSLTFQTVLAALANGLATAVTSQFANTAHLPSPGFPPDPTALITSGLTVIGFNVRFGANLLQHTHGHSPYSNIGVVYVGSANDAALNAGAGRFASHPDAVEYVEHYYLPTGDLRIPVLTLHTTFDPVVPFQHEALYAAMVSNAGASDFLVQRSVNRYGHCAFNAVETFNAFNDLVTWVLTGQKPAGGDATVP